MKLRMDDLPESASVKFDFFQNLHTLIWLMVLSMIKIEFVYSSQNIHFISKTSPDWKEIVMSFFSLRNHWLHFPFLRFGMACFLDFYVNKIMKISVLSLELIIDNLRILMAEPFHIWF